MSDMGKQIQKIVRQMQMTKPEILASLIWDRAVNSKDHIFKVPYYNIPCYLEYSTEDDFLSIDCLYLGVERSFFILKADYKSVLAVAPDVLQWLDETFAAQAPAVAPKTTARPRRPRRQPSMNRLNNAANLRAINQQAVKVAANQLLKAQQQQQQQRNRNINKSAIFTDVNDNNTDNNE